jgi:hypothetical protein
VWSAQFLISPFIRMSAEFVLGEIKERIALEPSPETFKEIGVLCVAWSYLSDAGKSFPVSSHAVEIVRNNIQKLGERLLSFNNKFNFHDSTPPNDGIEVNWPVPIL